MKRSIAFLLVHAPAVVLGFAPPPCPPPSSSLSMAKGRRGGLDVGDANSNGGKPRPIAANAVPFSSPVSPKKGKWSPVSGLSSVASLPKEPNAVQLIDTLVPALIDKQTNPTGAVSVVNFGETTYCFSSNCASCKIPLTKAKVLGPTEETGEGESRTLVGAIGPRSIRPRGLTESALSRSRTRDRREAAMR